eukprot:m.138799 g.138799  ORF g.138799 m.138799 type:complete len:144 (-) comp17596_c0_seq3:1-432(-)
MFYDLFIPAERGAEKTLSMLARLGYSCAAASCTVTGKIPQDVGLLAKGIDVDVAPDVRATLAATGKSFTVLKRITVELSDTKECYHLNGNTPGMKEFDIVAVNPTTEKLWAQCCVQSRTAKKCYSHPVHCDRCTHAICKLRCC